MLKNNKIINHIAQKVMTKSISGSIFHDLKYFEIGCIFSYSVIFYKLESTITKISTKISITC
jgi:hypothetical protein